VLKLINSLPLAGEAVVEPAAGEDAAPTGVLTSRDGEAEVEAAVMETAVVWYGALLEAVVVALPYGGTDGTAHEL